LKKADLETALDEHLRTNASIFQGDDRLADYYKRLSRPGRVSSPVKKEAKSDVTPASDEPKRPSRRRTTKVEVDATCVYVFFYLSLLHKISRPDASRRMAHLFSLARDIYHMTDP
jgi:hypothetical protein